MEVLISTTIMALISVVLIAFFIIYMRIWRRNSAQAQSFPPAYTALARITSDIRSAAYVNAPLSTDANQAWIIIYPPQQAPDAQGVMANYIPLMVKSNAIINATSYLDVDKYYLSNETGANNATGSYLWLRTFNENATTGATTTTALKLIAKNVTQLKLNYIGKDTYHIYGIDSVSMTEVGQEKSHTESSSFSTKIAFRNPMVSVIPITPTF
ncbi:MAG: hypothetical protein WCJ56_00195 [bacterium]